MSETELLSKHSVFGCSQGWELNWIPSFQSQWKRNIRSLTQQLKKQKKKNSKKMLCLWFQERVAWGFLGVVFWILRGVFLVQYLLDRHTWKHQQNSCLLHFVPTLLKQMSSVYMFCVNKQRCTYTHKLTTFESYISLPEKNNLAKSQELTIAWARRVEIIHARFSEYWCQIARYWLTHIVALCLLPAQLPCRRTEQHLNVCSSD